MDIKKLKGVININESIKIGNVYYCLSYITFTACPNFTEVKRIYKITEHDDIKGFGHLSEEGIDFSYYNSVYDVIHGEMNEKGSYSSGEGHCTHYEDTTDEQKAFVKDLFHDFEKYNIIDTMKKKLIQEGKRKDAKIITSFYLESLDFSSNLKR